MFGYSLESNQNTNLKNVETLRHLSHYTNQMVIVTKLFHYFEITYIIDQKHSMRKWLLITSCFVPLRGFTAMYIISLSINLFLY